MLKTILHQSCVLLFWTIYVLSPAQTVEIQGKAKITIMEEYSDADSVVVHQADGTLAVINPAVFVIRVLLDNGTADLQSLLISGQSVKTLLQAGVSPDELYGKIYQGGLIFYIDSLGGTGMVAAENDQNTGAAWGCPDTLIAGANGTDIGAGSQNTIDIDSDCSTSGIAANLCTNLSLNGYEDWFLPSKNELLEILNNLHGADLGNFSNSRYWTSSQGSASHAWDINFLTGSPLLANKGISRHVRAARSF